MKRNGQTIRVLYRTLHHCIGRTWEMMRGYVSTENLKPLEAGGIEGYGKKEVCLCT